MASNEEHECWSPGGRCEYQTPPFFKLKCDDGQEFVFCRECIAVYLECFPDTHYEVWRLDGEKAVPEV